MNDPAASLPSLDSAEAMLRFELARADATAGTVAPILRHLLASDDHSLFSDEIVARVRGMVMDLASRLLVALADSGQNEARENALLLGHLGEVLLDNPALIAHLHALVLEWQLFERLQSQIALDPVLPPLLQALIASPDAATAETAMKLLAAQARFVQSQRRMACQLVELPGDLFHAVLVSFRTSIGNTQAQDDRVSEVERRLRSEYDESRSRLGLIARLIAGMGGGAIAALSVAHAGVSTFLSALAFTSGQRRDLAALATHETQVVRLALALRAANLRPAALTEQFLTFHPFASPPDVMSIAPDRAAALLARAGDYPGA